MKVLEIGSGFPIWHAGRLLQALGAQVARVEPPGGIQVTEADSGSHRVLNSRKAVFTADLRSDEGRATLRQELASTDVLLLGLRPPTAEQWKLTPAALADHEHLIHGWITAFGSRGRLSALAAHDINAAGLTGLAWVEGMQEPGGMIPVRTPVTDLAAAFFLVIGVLDAAQKRATGARGLIAREVSMAGAGLASLAAWAPTVFAGRDEALLATPGYGVYRAQDGAPMALGALDPWQQTILRRLTGADGDGAVLSDERVASLVASRPSADWLEIANREGLAISRVLMPRDVLDDADVREHVLGQLDPNDPWRALLFPVANGPADHDRGADADSAVQQALFSSFADNQPKQEVR